MSHPLHPSGTRDLSDDEFVDAFESLTLADDRFRHYGAAKYHETITRAYMRLVAAHVRQTPDISAFDAFAAAHPDLMDKQLPRVYYSEALLSSVTARQHWVDPDIAPLPEIAAH